METLSTAAQDDSSGANPSSIKSDDSSPRPDSGRGSPPPNCAICLGTCRNKSFTDSCLHQFCFKCLLTWSKVKAECPLCKQNFRSIIHNVRSNHQYEEYMVEQRHTEESADRIDIDALATATRRFRYRTTLTLPRRETIAIQQLLVHYPLMADMFPPPMSRAPPARRRRSPAAFRRTVYRHNLWARPLPDFTGRFRDCTPEFYRYNDTQMHRLVPWINRELHYLLNENVGHISYVLTRILELLPQYHISSTEFREAMQRYFGERTDHFLHELYCFASTPYDMTGYDRNVQYTTDTRISTMVNEVISSSDSDASVDSDIVMVSHSEPAEPPAGPSRVPAPVYPQNYIPQPPVNNVIPIETISHSDTDDDSSEVMVVGYIKPPQDRTPEVVDLLGSDSDVIVQDTTQPEPAQSTSWEVANNAAPQLNLVKLSLKRHTSRDTDDSDDSLYRPSPPRRRRRTRSHYTATTSDTCRTTPSPSPLSPMPSPLPPPDPTPPWTPARSPSSMPSPPADATPPWTPSRSPSLSSSYTPSTSLGPCTSPSTQPTASNYSDTTTSYSSTDRRKRPTKKRAKRKINRDSKSTAKSKNKKRSTSRSHHRDKRSSSSLDKDTDKRSKRKSHSGKGVKSSKKVPIVVAPSPAELEQPSTSGVSRKRKSDKKQKRRGSSRESKRLKSVVSVIRSQKNSTESGSSHVDNSSVVNTLNSTVLNPDSRGSIASDDRTRRLNHVPPESLVESGYSIEQPVARLVDADDSDSEDDLPLNLTVQKTYHAL